MASKYWLKLFHETIYDPKVMKMTPGARLRFYECLCLAGDYDKDGELPLIDDMAFIFRITEEQLLDELQELARSGIVDADGDIYTIRKFHSRQEAMSASERMARMRDTKRHEEYLDAVTTKDNTCYEPVTKRKADIDIDIDKEKIKKREEKKISTAIAVTDWNQSITTRDVEQVILEASGLSALSTGLVEKIETVHQMLDRYDKETVLTALKDARSAWVSTRRKDNSRNYSVLNPAWVDWAVAHLSGDTPWKNASTMSAYDKALASFGG